MPARGMLWLLLRRRIGNPHDGYLWDGIWRTAVATGVMLAVIVPFRLAAVDALGMGLTGIVGAGVGGAVFLGSSTALKMEETQTVLGIVLRKLKRS